MTLMCKLSYLHFVSYLNVLLPPNPFPGKKLNRGIWAYKTTSKVQSPDNKLFIHGSSNQGNETNAVGNIYSSQTWYIIFTVHLNNICADCFITHT